MHNIELLILDYLLEILLVELLGGLFEQILKFSSSF